MDTLTPRGRPVIPTGRRGSKAVLVTALALVGALVMLEAASRTYLTAAHHVPFLRPDKEICRFYPQLRKVAADTAKNSCYRVLVLGCSPIAPYKNDFNTVLAAKLQSRLAKPVKIFNFAKEGHTTRDAAVEYSYLAQEHFDLTVIYHGINDLRANCCPPSVFKPDYSHYYWYDELNLLVRHRRWIRWVSFPYSLQQIGMLAAHRIFGVSNRIPERLVDTNFVKNNWSRYGDSIKTAVTLEQNISSICSTAAGKGERVILMSFCAHFDPRYEEKHYASPALDYAQPLPFRIETYGEVDHLKKGLRVQNDILRAISRRYANASFVDQDSLIPKGKLFFNDLCHFTKRGTSCFVDNLIASGIEPPAAQFANRGIPKSAQ